MAVSPGPQAHNAATKIIDPRASDLRGGIPRRALEYWNRRRNGAELARRADLNPAEIVDMLPAVFLVDVLPGPSRYRYRLIGTQIAEWSGNDATGRDMDDPQCGEGSTVFIALHDEVVALRKPVATVNSPALFQGSMLLFDRILLPMAGDDGAVVMIMGAADAVPAPRHTAADRQRLPIRQFG